MKLYVILPVITYPMKYILIISLFLSANLFSQISTSDSLKLLKIQEFIEDHQGKKVGTGLCIDLITATLAHLNKDWKQDVRINAVNKYGQKFDGKGLRVGDIVLLKECFYNNKRSPNHIGIIVGFEEETGILYIAHQNIFESNLKNSKVLLTDYSNFAIDAKKVEYYRPFLSE